MEDDFRLFPVALIRRTGETTELQVFKNFEGALHGLDGFSHIILVCWFHESDTPEKRATLQVHPRNDKSNPLTGVFATRSPRRPNPVALYASRVRSIRGNVIGIDPIDVRDGTPVVDIKPYIPDIDSIPEAAVPKWVKRR
jgi:tRNA-Thr(GGU) m(6)t(6)A37 methyltransferase TsaA